MLFVFSHFFDEYSAFLHGVPDAVSIVRVQSFHLFRELFHFQSIPLSFVWAGFDQRLIVLLRRPFFQQAFRDGSHGADERHVKFPHLQENGHGVETSCEGLVEECCLDEVVLVVSEGNFSEPHFLCFVKEHFPSVPSAEEAGTPFLVGVRWEGSHFEVERNAPFVRLFSQVVSIGAVAHVWHSDVQGSQFKSTLASFHSFSEQVHQGEGVFPAGERNQDFVAGFNQRILTQRASHDALKFVMCFSWGGHGKSKSQRVKETKRLRDKETKSWGVNGQWSIVNGQWSMVNGQWSKRLRDIGRKNRLFETLILYFLRKISSIDFYLKNIYLKNIKREGRGIAKARNLFVEISFWDN